MMPIETVRRDVPDLYLRHLAETVRDGYALAGQVCHENFRSPKVRENTICWNRRSFIEDALLELPEALVDEASIEHVRNGSWWHVEVTLGGVVILQATAPGVDAPIRPSNHKSFLARETQGLLDFGDSDEVDTSTPKVFAALTHSPRQGEPENPAFALVKVPKLGADGTIVGFYDGCIDLMDEFPDVFGPISEVEPEEPIEDVAFPELLDEEDTGA